jgi:hypothetical protein
MSLEKGYRKFRRDVKYLDENADDLLFGLEDWFYVEKSKRFTKTFRRLL